jgi:mono/diheme cytochrome c family protein
VQAAGASPALYYAKIACGGMGTGMPNWGTRFPEDDLWALTDYLMHLVFDDAAGSAAVDPNHRPRNRLDYSLARLLPSTSLSS